MKRSRNRTKTLLGIETLEQSQSAQLRAKSRNRTKTLLGIETFPLIVFGFLTTIASRNRTKTLLGIETQKCNKTKALRMLAAIELKPY